MVQINSDSPLTHYNYPQTKLSFCDKMRKMTVICLLVVLGNLKGVEPYDDVNGNLTTTEHPPEEHLNTSPEDFAWISAIVVLYILVGVYMFVALAILYDKFFVPSISVVTETLGIKHDVAGATFMAVGTSAPALFASILGVFVSHDDVTVGVIVGTAVFRTLFVIGMCALLSKTILPLSWWPLLRDCSFYSLALFTLIFTFRDQQIMWLESLGLLFIYVAYIIFMKYDRDIQGVVTRICCKPCGTGANAPSSDVNVEEGQLKRNAPISEGGMTLDDTEQTVPHKEPLDMSWPRDCTKRISYIVVFPVMIGLYLTLPDMNKPRGRKCFVWGFLGSIFWSIIFSNVIIWCVLATGVVTGVPPRVMGLTFGTAGTPIPLLIASVIVTRKSLGDMAVSSSMGCNIFDVCLRLPFPWLLYTFVNQVPIEVSASGMLCSISILFGVLLFLVITITLFRWRMTKGLGIVMVVLYFIFLGLSFLLEYDVMKCPI